jgi:hypothetical protein
MKRAIRLLAIGDVVVFLLASVSGSKSATSTDVDTGNTVRPKPLCPGSSLCIPQYILATGVGAAVGILAGLFFLHLLRGFYQEIDMRPSNER